MDNRPDFPFGFHRWLARAARANRLARAGGFHFCTCSGIGQLQGVLDGLRQRGAFIVADDVCILRMKSSENGA